MKTHTKDTTEKNSQIALCGAYLHDETTSTEHKWAVEGQDPSCKKCKNALARFKAEQEMAVREKAEQYSRTLREEHMTRVFGEKASSFELGETERARGPVTVSGEAFSNLLSGARYDLENAHAQLLSHIAQLAKNLTRETEDLKREGLSARPNSLGMIQGQGSEIDRLTSEFRKAQEVFARLVRFVEKARGTPGFQSNYLAE